MMRRFRLWLARKLVGSDSFVANTTFSNGTLTTAVAPSSDATFSFVYFEPGTITGNTFATEDEMSKKKRSKAAGKAAAKAKTEKTQKRKAKGGKGAR